MSKSWICFISSRISFSNSAIDFSFLDISFYMWITKKSLIINIRAIFKSFSNFRFPYLIFCFCDSCCSICHPVLKCSFKTLKDSLVCLSSFIWVKHFSQNLQVPLSQVLLQFFLCLDYFPHFDIHSFFLVALKVKRGSSEIILLLVKIILKVITSQWTNTLIETVI